jgi:hypothetical protein
MHAMTHARKALPAVLTPLLAIFLTVGLVAASLTTSPSSSTGQLPSHRLVAEDDEVVLPGRLAAAINRTNRAVDRAEAAIDDHRPRAARRALRATIKNAPRATAAGMHQMNAVPVDPEAETTPGPDAAIAVLNLHQGTIIRLSGLFDTLLWPRVITKLNRAMTVSHNQRMRVVNAVVGLDPEGAGADYADGMADAVDGYGDEVSAISEALSDDHLTKTSRAALSAARAHAISAQTKVTAAFGGGE